LVSESEAVKVCDTEIDEVLLGDDEGVALADLENEILAVSEIDVEIEGVKLALCVEDAVIEIDLVSEILGVAVADTEMDLLSE